MDERRGRRSRYEQKYKGEQRGWWVNTFVMSAVLKKRLGKARRDDVMPVDIGVIPTRSLADSTQCPPNSSPGATHNSSISTVYLGAYVCSGLLQSTSSTLSHRAGLSNSTDMKRHRSCWTRGEQHAGVDRLPS